MKQAMATAAAVWLCLAASEARAGRVEFDGRFHLTAANATCVSMGDVTYPADFRYAPPNLGTNGPATHLTALYGNAAENWTLASGDLVSSTWQNVTATGMGVSAGQLATKMRIRKQTPATLTDTTPSVTIVGDIQNFQEDAGCTISFIGTGYLK